MVKDVDFMLDFCVFRCREHGVQSVEAPIETSTTTAGVGVVMVATTLFVGISFWLTAFSGKAWCAKRVRVCLVFIVGVIVLVGFFCLLQGFVRCFIRRGRCVEWLEVYCGTVGDEFREEGVGVMCGGWWLGHFEN